MESIAFNFPRYQADSIAPLTDSCSRKINIKLWKYLSHSHFIKQCIHTASHCAVACFQNMYFAFQRLIHAATWAILRNIKINANRPELRASFCATTQPSERGLIQLLIAAGPFSKKHPKPLLMMSWRDDNYFLNTNIH